MCRRTRWITLFAFSLGICAAQAPTFTGSWKLNVSRSTWGSKQRPATVTVDIDHNQESFKYTGVVVGAAGDERNFEFAGATDGRKYPATRVFGEGKVTLERIGRYTILTTFKSNDGNSVERTRMSLSPNGKILTYDIHVSDRGRNVHWTEVYEKQ
jgi:hypothetical protein